MESRYARKACWVCSGVGDKLAVCWAISGDCAVEAVLLWRDREWVTLMDWSWTCTRATMDGTKDGWGGLGSFVYILFVCWIYIALSSCDWYCKRNCFVSVSLHSYAFEQIISPKLEPMSWFFKIWRIADDHISWKSLGTIPGSLLDYL